MEHNLRRLSSFFAVCGGAILVLLIVMSCVSIIGRILWAAPLNGDFELIQMGTASAIFAFLPWAFLQRGHIRIEILSSVRFPRLCACLDGVADTLFLLFGLALMFYLSLGGYQSYADNAVTMVLALPVWWGFAAAVLSSSLLAAVCAYSCRKSWRRFLTFS